MVHDIIRYSFRGRSSDCSEVASYNGPLFPKSGSNPRGQTHLYCLSAFHFSDTAVSAAAHGQCCMTSKTTEEENKESRRKQNQCHKIRNQTSDKSHSSSCSCKMQLDINRMRLDASGALWCCFYIQVALLTYLLVLGILEGFHTRKWL